MPAQRPVGQIDRCGIFGGTQIRLSRVRERALQAVDDISSVERGAGRGAHSAFGEAPDKYDGEFLLHGPGDFWMCNHCGPRLGEPRGLSVHAKQPFPMTRPGSNGLSDLWERQIASCLGPAEIGERSKG
jgi:hypothetical protein